jgi:hypothetical protein
MREGLGEVMKKLIFLFIFISTQAWSLPTMQTIHYQGRLVDDAVPPQPVNGNTNITFNLYRNVALVCSQTEWVNLAGTNGAFNIDLDFDGGCSGPPNLTGLLFEAAIAGDSINLEIVDNTNARTYDRQLVTLTPLSTIARFAVDAVGANSANEALMVDSKGAATGDYLVWNGSDWMPQAVTATSPSGSGTVQIINTGDGLQGGPITSGTGNITMDIDATVFEIVSNQLSIRANSIGSSKLAADIDGSKLAAGSVALDRLSQTPCESDGTNCDGVLPTNMIVHVSTPGCPTGWTELTAARGRYLVAKPSAGTLGGTVGTALTDQENRDVGQHAHTGTFPTHWATHSHTVNDGGALSISHSHSGSISTDVHSHSDLSMWQSGGLADDRPDGGGAGANPLTPTANPGLAHSPHTHTVTVQDGGNHSHTYGTAQGLTTEGNHTHFITIDDEGSTTGTNAPYLQLLTCIKT